MDYSLAIELKNAGFPQGGTGRWIVDPSLIVVRTGDRAYIPTLSELIEECGENFETLVRYKDGTYRAYRRNGPEDLQAIPSNTPTEAVARLWLALNKK